VSEIETVCLTVTDGVAFAQYVAGRRLLALAHDSAALACLYFAFAQCVVGRRLLALAHDSAALACLYFAQCVAGRRLLALAHDSAALVGVFVFCAACSWETLEGARTWLGGIIVVGVCNGHKGRNCVCLRICARV
jgi:hypothetical protein